MIKTMAMVSLGAFYVQAIIFDKNLECDDSQRIFMYGFLTVIKPVQNLLWNLGHGTARIGSSLHSSFDGQEGEVIKIRMPMNFDAHCMYDSLDVVSLCARKTYPDYEKYLVDSRVVYEEIYECRKMSGGVMRLFGQANTIMSYKEDVGIDIIMDDRPRCLTISNGEFQLTNAKVGISLVETAESNKSKTSLLGMIMSRV